MLSRETLIAVWEAAQSYDKGIGNPPDPSQIIPLLPNLSPEAFAYLCRCIGCSGHYSPVTTKQVLEVFPKYITGMGPGYLIELLRFPWPSFYHEISPARVVIGIAEKQGFLSPASRSTF